MNSLPGDLSFVCFSTAHWDAPLWTNRQRIMNILSESYPVLFVEPGLHSKVYTRQLLRQRPGRFWPGRWFRQEKERLWVYAPALLSLYRFPPRLQAACWQIALAQVRHFCRRHGFERPILWMYPPEAVVALGKLDERLSLYDCVDNYAATPYYARSAGRRERLGRLEQELLRRVDVVITSTASLYEQKRKLNPNTYLAQNVGEAEHFARAMRPETAIPEELAAIPRPIIGYVGAVNDRKVDFALLAQLAQQHPTWQWVLIGPIGGWGTESPVDLLRRPNIHLLGKKPYETLPNYVKAFDVCLIPYLINDYTKDVFPLKFFEFLASGKPVVTAPLPALLPYRELVYIADSADDFSCCLQRALNEPQAGLAERLAVARQNTWQHRVDKIMDAIRETLEHKSNDHPH